MYKEKRMPAIEGVDTDFFWPAEDTGLYGYFNDINNNSGPVGDWFASHKDVIEKISKNKNGTVIQAGGAVGMYPILLSKYFQTIFTFEPDPVNNHFLRKNLEHHQVKNVHVSDFALNNDESDKYFSCISNSNRGMASFASGKTNDSIIVKTTTIDSVFNGYNDSIDLIWLDIEGYESYALEGAVKTIRLHEPAIGVERPTEKVFEILNRLGYIPWKNSKMDVFFVK